MFFLRLTCRPADVDLLSAELWDAGTAGIQEIDYGDTHVLLAGFETNEPPNDLLHRFEAYAPDWEHDKDTDWVEHTKRAWPPRLVGDHLFLAPPWCEEVTPGGRVRVVHNPGLACGTGEHPCTQLALEALEKVVSPGQTVVDIGTGSGILSVAALHLGAARTAGLDVDEAALYAARENFGLNHLCPKLAVGSADAVVTAVADVTVANISGTVLLALIKDLLRITKPGGTLILTGFPEWERSALQTALASHAEQVRVSDMSEWRCLIAKL